MKLKKTLKVALAIMLIAIIIAVLVIIYFPAPDILTGNPIDDILIGIIALPVAIITIVITFFVFIIAFIKLLKKANKQTKETKDTSKSIETENEHRQENNVEEIKTSECKICGKEAYGYKLCRECYIIEKNKMNNKEYLTKDGNIVRSRAELIIYEHLLDKGYEFVYEAEMPFLDKYGNTITLHPDFCVRINGKIIFIEYWGLDERHKKYTEIKNKKLELYDINNVPLINLYEDTDGEYIREILDEELKIFQESVTSEEEKE